MKSYELALPVYKQGDDLYRSIEDNPGNLAAAFEQQAEDYEEAARLCRRMAGVAVEVPELAIDAGNNRIGIHGPEERLESLVQEGVLSVYEHGSEEEDDDEEEEDDDIDGDELDEDDDEQPHL